MALWRTLGFVAVVVCTGALGCEKSDVGTCCQVLAGRDMSVIPVPMQTDKGEWIDDISLDPAFDCEDLTCVSYQGSNAYCTKKCEFAENCPDGFDCVSVIASDPGPGSNIGPNDKFCVQQAVQFSCEQ